MNGWEIPVLVVIIVVILMAVSAGRLGRRGGSERDRDGDSYPWWTFGLFALGSRADEEAREARDDARFAGDDTMNVSGSPDDRDAASGPEDSDDTGSDDDGGSDDGGDDGGSDD